MFPPCCSYLLLPAEAFFPLVVLLQVFSSDLLLLSLFRCLHVLFFSPCFSSSCSRLQSVQPVAVATDPQVSLPTHSTGRQQRETTSRIIFPEITATNTTSAKTGIDMPGLLTQIPQHTHANTSCSVCLPEEQKNEGSMCVSVCVFVKGWQQVANLMLQHLLTPYVCPSIAMRTLTDTMHSLTKPGSNLHPEAAFWYKRNNRKPKADTLISFHQLVFFVAAEIFNKCSNVVWHIKYLFLFLFLIGSINCEPDQSQSSSGGGTAAVTEWNVTFAVLLWGNTGSEQFLISGVVLLIRTWWTQ